MSIFSNMAWKMVGIEVAQDFLKERSRYYNCPYPTSWIFHLPRAARLHNTILLLNQTWYFSQYPLRKWLVPEFNHLFIVGGQEWELHTAGFFSCYCDFKLHLMGYLKGRFCHLGEQFRKLDWLPCLWMSKAVKSQKSYKKCEGEMTQKIQQGQLPPEVQSSDNDV